LQACILHVVHPISLQGL